MERRAHLPETIPLSHPETRAEGRDRRTPVSPPRESGERPAEQVRYFDIENRVAGTPEFAVRTDPETGLVVFVDGRDAPPEAAAHVANGIFAAAKRGLPILSKHEAVQTGAQGLEVYRPRRLRTEEALASAAENALPVKDLLMEDAALRDDSDRVTPLELPASAALAIVPERITAGEIIGADVDTAERMVGTQAVTADEEQWRTYVTPFLDRAEEQRRRYEASVQRIAPLLDRAGRFLKGGEAARGLVAGPDDFLVGLRRAASDLLAAYRQEVGIEPVGEMRRQRKRDYRAGKKNYPGIWNRIIELPVFSAKEKAALAEHQAVLEDAGDVALAAQTLMEQREDATRVRALYHELRAAGQDAERLLEERMSADRLALASDERMLLAELLAMDQIVRDPRLLDRLREPDLTPDERTTLATLEDLITQRREPVAAVMATDAFRGLSRAARFTLAERLKDVLPEPEQQQLLETRAVSISGRLGNDILVYRLRNGRLEPLHDAINRRGQETIKLRGLERPVLANQTARESFNAEFGDQFVLLPAEHAQLRADATLAAAKDPEAVLRQLADDESYPLLRITVRPPKKTAAAPALDTAAKNG